MTRRAWGPLRVLLLAGCLCFLVAGAALVVWTGSRDDPAGSESGAAPGQSSERGAQDTGPSREGRPPAAPPVKLDIPAIDLSSRLVRLGLEPDRTVEVPTDADLAGWFRMGPVPGERGSSVILGHVDSVEGPAVFARLGELRQGDLVKVGRADGSVVSFVVTRRVLYPNADFPAQRVYAAQDGRRLNLVTCAGAYLQDAGGYQSNLVVYTRRTL
ncbi:class F sortase [Nocardioides sp. LHG3406-4]|uniref:class F sortase n=1 Tax=Nocardioides sp. LHG3406-4 TaxID=2804575 RepID=UPI003CFAA604